MELNRFSCGTATGSLSGEIAVGTTPGGSLGGTWASPTIDDLFVKNDASDAMTGTLTCQGVLPDGDNTRDLGSAAASFNDVFADGTVSGVIVDTKYIEYSSGGAVTVRDSLTSAGAITANNIAGNKTIHFTVDTPASLSATDLLPIWSNETGKTLSITSLKGWSNAPYDVVLKSMDNDGQNVATLANFAIATPGTSIYYGSNSVASGVIVANKVIYFDASAQANNQVKVTISGTLN